jgi:hypothetical protein
MTVSLMSEADLQANVVELVGRLGGMTYHTHDSRRSAAGFPDLVIVFPRTGWLGFAELKSATGKVSPDQRRWLHALLDTPAEVHLWRPANWPDPIVDVLTLAAREVRR